MSELTRRQFLTRGIATGLAGAAVLSGSRERMAEAGQSGVGTMIDLSKCDGCKTLSIPKCVSACREKNTANFPQPKQPIPLNFPLGTNEDWSKKKHLTNRLTPYNWTYVQKVQVTENGKSAEISLPRRCMHCDNPPCANLCPFGMQTKSQEGPVVIDKDGCLGGAKCRSVCPWQIPQRQAGVGIYMKMAPKYLGGGVMYKCDLCLDLIRQGQEPACVQACPQKAIHYGSKEEMRQLAHQRAQDIAGYIYGEKENGGTSTFYVSPVSFKAINQALLEHEVDGKNGRMGMKPLVENVLDKPEGMAKQMLFAPIAGIFAAGMVAYKTMKGAE